MPNLLDLEARFIAVGGFACFDGDRFLPFKLATLFGMQYDQGIDVEGQFHAFGLVELHEEIKEAVSAGLDIIEKETEARYVGATPAVRGKPLHFSGAELRRCLRPRCTKEEHFKTAKEATDSIRSRIDGPYDLSFLRRFDPFYERFHYAPRFVVLAREASDA